MKHQALISFLIGTFASSVTLPAFADFPENNLHLEDNLHIQANITEAEFNSIVDDIITVYKPIALGYGAKLTANKDWASSTVNAYANQVGNDWYIDMLGGLARRPEVTKDGFALVVCHELGHHFGGYPLKGARWASSEGQSDYFATQSCARRIWLEDDVKNAEFRKTVDPTAKKLCDTQWNTDREQNLCYRVATAGHSLAHLLAVLGGKTAVPAFDTPDQTKVTKTSTSHPDAQCRLDTYLAGGLCVINFDMGMIPGKGHVKGQESAEAEWNATMYSCTSMRGHSEAQRPSCWFKPLL